VATPHLDALAARGRRFTRAFATAPVCSSSRSAFILGSYQTTTGLHPHDTEAPQPLPAPYEPLPKLLKKAGYFVTNASAPGSERGGKQVKKAKTHYNFQHDPATLYDGTDWKQRHQGQPFFAQYQVTEPHRAFPIPEHFDEAALKALKLPSIYPDHPLQLSEAGVLDNTIVMFFADHGRPMPWGKQWLTIEGLRVPLIVSGPSILPGVEEGLVSLIDLAPSVLALAGQSAASWMEGRAVLSGSFPARDHIFAARDRCGDAMDRVRAVISKDWLVALNSFPELPRSNWSSYKEDQYPGLPLLRLMEAEKQLSPQHTAWFSGPRGEWEVYDLKNDPQGLTALPSPPAETATLVSKLQAWSHPQRDLGASGDPTTEPALSEIQRSKRADYQRTWKKRLGNAEPTDAERVQWWKQQYGLGE
jgi:N-sulfoglucosamine sulfohydrolase